MRTFQKYETEDVQSLNQKGVDINAPFKALYESPPMTAADAFKLMYTPGKKALDEKERFEQVPQPKKQASGPRETTSPKTPEESPAEREPLDTSTPQPDEPQLPEETKPPEEQEPEPPATQPPPQAAPPPEAVAPPEIDVEAIKQEAYGEGFQKGEADGFAQGQAQAAAAANHLEEICGRLDSLWGDMVRANEEKLVHLINLIVDKIVYGHISVDHDVVKKAILDAFYLLPEPESAVIYVNNEDYEFVEAIKDDFFKALETLKQISVIADPSVGRGGCRIESEAGDVDAALESRLAAVKQSIIDVAGKKPTS